ncbi:MAG TPA: hypothetical protein VMZ53_16765 [Kofleriaceae bacterium]|nr:hypothetical protein [Kofleriaceae bacterium]
MNRTVLEYTQLLSRAFNGAIEVDGTRIVAHPSGTLIARTPNPMHTQPVAPRAQPLTLDPENDWTNV